MAIEIHEVRVPGPGTSGQDWEIAATIFLPGALALASGPDILFLLAGASYSRGYFNLPVAGYSQAMYHAGRGNIVVTLDYLGTGDSSTPSDATLADAAASTHNAAMYIEEKLVKGNELIKDLGPVRYGALVAAGQSLGGHVLTATQANHGTFKGIALLGTSVAGTQYPTRGGGKTEDPAQVDFTYAFHWLEDPKIDASTTPTDLTTLVGVDIAIGCPRRTGTAPWASNTTPSYTMETLAPGVASGNAAKVESTVLLAAGERDMTRPLDEEAAVFKNALDVGTFTQPQAAHMHNFSETRELLWKRLDTFVMHASTSGRKLTPISSFGVNEDGDHGRA